MADIECNSDFRLNFDYLRQGTDTYILDLGSLRVGRNFRRKKFARTKSPREF